MAENKKGKRVTTFMLAQNEKQALEKLAQREGRSVSGQIRYILKKELSRKPMRTPPRKKKRPG